MRAAVWTKYGPPEGLVVRELPMPEPRETEVLIRVRAAGVAAGDAELRALRFGLGMRVFIRLIMGPFRPRSKVLGQEFAGDVVRTSGKASRFHVGDAVYGATGFRFGAYAEFVCLPEIARDGAIALKPARLSYEEAATIPTGGIEALHSLRWAGDLAGRHLLVNGAAGGIGLMAVQLAKQFGAEVTGVDRIDKLDLLRSLGADHVIDYQETDFTKSSGPYDVILDVVGKVAVTDCLNVLRPGGCCILANPSLGAMFRGRFRARREQKRVMRRPLPPTPAELDQLRGLIDAGGVRAVIDRTFPLEQITEAHRYLDSGVPRGRVVLVA